MSFRPTVPVFFRPTVLVFFWKKCIVPHCFRANHAPSRAASPPVSPVIASERSVRAKQSPLPPVTSSRCFSGQRFRCSLGVHRPNVLPANGPGALPANGPGALPAERPGAFPGEREGIRSSRIKKKSHEFRWFASMLCLSLLLLLPFCLLRSAVCLPLSAFCLLNLPPA